jgi:transcription initiation factor TFIID subunit 4
MDKRYEVSKEVRPQIRFLEELDKLEKKRHEEAERVVLLRAAKVCGVQFCVLLIIFQLFS